MKISFPKGCRRGKLVVSLSGSFPNTIPVPRWTKVIVAVPRIFRGSWTSLEEMARSSRFIELLFLPVLHPRRQDPSSGVSTLFLGISIPMGRPPRDCPSGDVVPTTTQHFTSSWVALTIQGSNGPPLPRSERPRNDLECRRKVVRLIFLRPPPKASKVLMVSYFGT